MGIEKIDYRSPEHKISKIEPIKESEKITERKQEMPEKRKNEERKEKQQDKKIPELDETTSEQFKVIIKAREKYDEDIKNNK